MRQWAAFSLLSTIVATSLCGIAAENKTRGLPEADPLITKIQDEIASFDAPSGYYATTYRRDETKYWEHIPTWMRSDASNHRALRILDIGCGYGTLLAYAMEVYHAEGYCMDVTHYLPEFGRIRGIHFTQGNIQLDPVPQPGSFDVIIMTEVLEHFNFKPLPTIKKLHSALASEGVFFLSTPDAAEWGRQIRYYSHLADLPQANPMMKLIDDHIWIYDRKELLGLISDADFRIDQSAYSPGVGHRHFNLLLRSSR